ncbi:MAG: RDD family protein [Halobacteriales archaeon]|nr:RDD family protein [Halobacteriales archaeon]
MAELDLIPSKRPPPPDMESASPALLRERALASVFDVGFCYFTFDAIVFASVIGLFPEWSAENSDVLFVNSLILLVPIYLSYVFVLEWRFARTPGKVWRGIMVATPDGDLPNLTQTAIRNMVRYIDWLPVFYLLGWWLAHRSPVGQRLGDRLAGTVVVRPGNPMRDLDEGADLG